MAKVNVKITMALFLYALLITALFVIGILSFSADSKQEELAMFLEDGLIELETEDPKQTLEPAPGEFLVDSSFDQYEALSKYADFSYERMMQKISGMAAGFCGLLILSSFVLWLVLKQIQKKETIRIANQLNSIQELHEFANDDPVLAKAYTKIQSEYERHITDYKRLHAYLSHEQKNALSLLRANLELRHFQDCLNNIEEITQGIDELVTLSERADPEQLEPVDIIMVAADVIDRYRSHETKLTFSYDEDALYVKAKPRWLSCALNNLIENAIKYGEGRPIHVSIQRKDDDVWVEVQDHGIGIAPEKQAQIFDQNYRINELNQDGYGIGLSLIQHVCTLCQGSISCESALGKGTTFIFRLPLRNPFNSK